MANMAIINGNSTPIYLPGCKWESKIKSDPEIKINTDRQKPKEDTAIRDSVNRGILLGAIASIL